MNPDKPQTTHLSALTKAVHAARPPVEDSRTIPGKSFGSWAPSLHFLVLRDVDPRSYLSPQPLRSCVITSRDPRSNPPGQLLFATFSSSDLQELRVFTKD